MNVKNNEKKDDLLEDSDVEDYTLAESNDGILPRTVAEERRMVDEY